MATVAITRVVSVASGLGINSINVDIKAYGVGSPYSTTLSPSVESRKQMREELSLLSRDYLIGQGFTFGPLDEVLVIGV